MGGNPGWRPHRIVTRARGLTAIPGDADDYSYRSRIRLSEKTLAPTMPMLTKMPRAYRATTMLQTTG